MNSINRSVNDDPDGVIAGAHSRFRHRVLLVTAAITLVLLFLFPSPCLAADGIFIQGNARFTIVTPTLIRLEYAPDGRFIDAPSFFAIERTARFAGAAVTRQDGTLTIDTGAIRLTYKRNKQPFFSPENLSAAIRNGNAVAHWSPGQKPSGNLGGTLTTLDMTVGPRPLNDGLLSRDGWSLVDDSNSVLLVDGWFKARPLNHGQDWYLFGDGNDFKQALRDLAAISGHVPMPRKYALGIWYSRYWPYTADDFKEIVNEYRDHDFPLDVLVMDMDWHLTDIKLIPPKLRPPWSDCLWTGYTWNRKLIPDPPALLNWLHQQGLAVTLNDHPAQSVFPYEDAYPGFMRAMGADPASGKVIPFDAGNRNYMIPFYETTHRVHEKEGVDFWWLDWQQEPVTRSIKSLSNLQALGYFYFQESGWDGRRGQDMSRWAGWGDHRYPVYFSGDALGSWDMLAYEIPFTSTAGNVGCFYWSHDMGGFWGQRADETYTRWSQFEAFSPVMRSHSTRDKELDRRPWTYAGWARDAMRLAFHLRAQWMPYIYSTAWQAHRDTLPLLRPMYLEYPGAATAYHQGQEYLFGDDVLVAPITTPGAGPDHVASQAVWFPPGDWYQVFSGEKFTGPLHALVANDITTFPLFARGGKPIPLQPYTPRPGTAALTHLIVRCYPGRDGEEGVTLLHEDDGISDAYERGAFATTRLSYRRDGSAVTVSIGPVDGTYTGQPQRRSYTIELPDTAPPGSPGSPGSPAPGSPPVEAASLPLTGREAAGMPLPPTGTPAPGTPAPGTPGSATLNGKPINPDYDAAARTIRVHIPELPIDQSIILTIVAAPADPALMRRIERQRLRAALLGMTDEAWAKSPAAAHPDPAITQTFNAIDGFGFVEKNPHPYLLGDEIDPVYYDRDFSGLVAAQVAYHGRTKALVLTPGQPMTAGDFGDFLPTLPLHGVLDILDFTIQRPGGLFRFAVPVEPRVDETCNLARQAQATFSSVYSGCRGLNDGVVGGYSHDAHKQWISKGERAGAWARLTWDKPVSIASVVLFNRPSLDDQVLAGKLSFSDGTTLSVGALPNGAGKGAQITFSTKTVTWVQFTVTKASPRTHAIGLAEMAVFATPRPELE